MTRAVVIGGGHGASASLRAALLYARRVGGIITVADDGGSSGRLSREMGVLPMGDIRNCLAALAPDSPVVDVFQHRFQRGPLEGHVVGNLIIAAVYEQTRDFTAAVDCAAQLIGSRGTVVPPTLDPVRLISEVEGEIVEGQVAVATARGRISYVALDPPDPKANPQAIDLLAEADQVILGPGSLFTSILPNLLVPGIRDALLATTARKVFVCNLAVQRGETTGFDGPAHLGALLGHLGPDAVDVVVAHQGRAPRWQTPPISIDPAGLAALGVEVVTADVLPDDAAARHDPRRLARVLATL